MMLTGNAVQHALRQGRHLLARALHAGRSPLALGALLLLGSTWTVVATTNTGAEFTSLDELARQAEERLSGLTQELDAEQRTLNERNAAVEDAKNQAAASEVHAPVSGIVTARKGEAGKAIGHEEAGELFKIAVDLSQLEVLITPEPPMLRQLRPGQPASISIAELPGTIAGAVRELKGSDVVVEFISPTPVIRPGMTANVRITLE